MIQPVVGGWLKTVALLLAALLFPVASPVYGEDGVAAGDDYITKLFAAKPDGSEPQPFTKLTQFIKQGSPAWSLDGKWIAFDIWKPGKGESPNGSRVVVMRADGTEPRVFDDAAMPSFSPGGNRIVVSRPNSGGVWVINLDRPAAEAFAQLDAKGWGADWSPDGQIVYATYGSSGANLMVADVAEGRRSLFTKAATPYRQIYWNMAWSRDSKHIAFKGINQDGVLEIGVVDARGESSGFRSRPEPDLLASFAWSPDGSQILFTKKSTERNHYQVYSIDPSLKHDPKLLSGLDPQRDYSDVAYSPDGQRIVFSCNKPTTVVPVAELKEEFTTRLFVAESDASNLKPVTELPEYQAQGSPHWSLDGKLIAFDAWMPQKGETFPDSRVIVVNADGTQPRIFPDAAMPSFSPGGRRMTVSRPKSGGVWVIDLDQPEGKNFIELEKSGWGSDWSPDGKIVFAKYGNNGANLEFADVIEGRRSLFGASMTPYTRLFWNMAWSRDGQQVAFKGMNRDGKIEVGIVDARGDTLGHQVRDTGTILASFAWSPDGSHVLYVKLCPERDHYQIYSVSPAGSDKPKLLTGQDPERSYADIAYSPDGKKLLISAWKRTPKVKPTTTPVGAVIEE